MDLCLPHGQQFKCDICKKSYEDKETLKRHKEKVTKPSPHYLLVLCINRYKRARGKFTSAMDAVT